MADGTKIEWADATVNAINGCSLASPGCTNCYAMRLAGTRLRNHPSREGLTTPSKAGPVWNGTVRLSETALMQPLRWRAPRVIFWNAHGDTFHDAVPDAWIDRMLAVMALTPQHNHLVLTKRSARMREYMARIADGGDYLGNIFDLMDELGNSRADSDLFARWPLSNVWLGVSVEDQARADERIPDLLATPTARRFLSCEPLLGPLDLNEWLICPNARDGLMMDPSTGQHECCSSCDWTGLLGGIDGVIVGGESGPGARPMHPVWARSLRDQCAGAGVDFHFKQWGEWIPDFEWGADWADDDLEQSRFDTCVWDVDQQRFDETNGSWFDSDQWVIADDYWQPEQAMTRIGKKRAGRLFEGVAHDALPWRREAAA